MQVTSIGMNHAELMARRGEYRLTSGDPPFTPGLEAGGIIDALGEGVTAPQIGQRVVVGVDAPRLGSAGGGTYRSQYICNADQAVPAPDALSDDQLGAIWLAYLTAWGCLVGEQNIQPGDIVAMPAASSSVALAAAQIVKNHGGIAIGLTSSTTWQDVYQHVSHLYIYPDGSVLVMSKPGSGPAFAFVVIAHTNQGEFMRLGHMHSRLDIAGSLLAQVDRPSSTIAEVAAIL